jgi:hypothetical protein
MPYPQEHVQMQTNKRSGKQQRRGALARVALRVARSRGRAGAGAASSLCPQQGGELMPSSVRHTYM